METPKGWEVLHSSLFPSFPVELNDKPPLPLKIVLESPGNSIDAGTRTVISATHSAPTLPSDSFSSIRSSSPLTRSSSSSSNRSSLLMSATKKRQSVLSGNGPPSARLSKLLGDFYLLSGRLNDATTWYVRKQPLSL